MAKVLTDKECADIVRRAVHSDRIADSDAYRHFLEGLGALIADHFGSDMSCVSDPFGEKNPDDPKGSEGRWCILFHWNDCVPDDGGVFKDYDKDVSIKEWKDNEESPKN